MISNKKRFCSSLSVLVIICVVDKATSYLADNLANCHCVLLKNCDTINELIHSSNDIPFLTSTIKAAVCEFDGSNIYVCCPEKKSYKRHAKHMANLDYIDDLSGLNCPPSFGKEYDYDEYMKLHPHDNDDDNYDDVHSKDENKDISNSKDESTEDRHLGPVYCNPWGNCVRFKFPKDDTQSNYNKSPEQHYHTYDHDNHDHGFRIPFFPFHHHHHPHDHEDDHDFSYGHHYGERPPEITSTTATPTRVFTECGTLPNTGSSGVYPWIVRLAYLNTTSRTVRHRCLGTIISDQHILTAAHCVDSLVNDLRLIYARVGDDNNFEDFKIIETTIHPSYNEPLFNNDVALLRLSRTHNSRIPISKICLPVSDSAIAVGSTGVVAGWSENGGALNAPSGSIRYINLPILNNTECAIRYAKYSENFESTIIITPREFCAKSEAMNDVCEGDSGGPFMDRSPTNRYTLEGIVAFGPKTNCGQSNLPGVYMRVSAYVNWIQQKITIP
ncbi:tryptase [Stomoxys calcitrans]|uniref:tryptase n=1 Tax=Stomoxys calcitrans TaxID=35570 RepID=UPI0027E396CE|nr:tryptase [Stomoxys calcitrans]